MIKIDIISDTVCPWCYIGKKRLDKAIEDYKDEDFDINWHAFQLNPTMPKEGVDRQLYLSTKFGGEERAIGVYNQIKNAGKSSNIMFNFDKINIMPNSFYSHMLLEYSKEEGIQNKISEELFEAFFIHGKNIGEFTELNKIAKLNNISIKAKFVVEGYLLGLHKSPYHGYSVEFAEHRSYEAGDEIKKIDWKLFGKTDRYYIKEYEEETNLRSYIILDTSKSMNFANESISKLDYGSLIASSFFLYFTPFLSNVSLTLSE